MSKTISLTTDVPLNRRVQIVLPPDVPPGPAEITMVITSPGQVTAPTLGELARSEFFGMWRDRADINDSLEFARRLRREEDSTFER